MVRKLTILREPNEINDLCQKVIYYLQRCGADIEKKFISAYNFLMLVLCKNGLSKQLPKGVIVLLTLKSPPPFPLEIQLLEGKQPFATVFCQYPTYKDYPFLLDAINRGLSLGRIVEKAFLKEFEKHLKNFTYGIGMYITKSLKRKDIVIYDHTEEKVTISKLLTAQSKKDLPEFVIRMLIKKYSVYYPDLRKQLEKNRYIKPIYPEFAFSLIFPLKLLKPFDEVKKAIIELVRKNRRCPICGEPLTPLRIRKDSKVCRKCRQKKYILKKELLKLEHEDPSLFSSLRKARFKLIEELKKKKQEKDNWLKAKGREKEIWTVYNWTAITEIICSEIENSYNKDRFSNCYKIICPDYR